MAIFLRIGGIVFLYLGVAISFIVSGFFLSPSYRLHLLADIVVIPIFFGFFARQFFRLSPGLTSCLAAIVPLVSPAIILIQYHRRPGGPAILLGAGILAWFICSILGWRLSKSADSFKSRFMSSRS